MRVYLAGLYAANISLESNFFRRAQEHEKAARRNICHLLESYHYIFTDRKAEEIRRDKNRIFLDSGAFSAYTLGTTISLDDYCDYCFRNADFIEVISVLDVIGDAQRTYEQQRAMELRGLRPLPCFHYGEDEKWLEFYVNNYDHITLGGIGAGAKPQLILWLDRIWGKYLTDANGMPKLKVHGFGLTREDLIARYPWYSVDSSSWVQAAMHGTIMLPDHGRITVSSASPQRKQEGRHIETMSTIEKIMLIREIEKRGFTLDRIANDYISRYCFNMHTFNELNTNETPKPFVPDVETFF